MLFELYWSTSKSYLYFRIMLDESTLQFVSVIMAVWEGVSTDSLKFHPGLPRLTFLRPAGGLQPSSTPLDTPRGTGLSVIACSKVVEN